MKEKTRDDWDSYDDEEEGRGNASVTTTSSSSSSSTEMVKLQIVEEGGGGGSVCVHEKSDRRNRGNSVNGVEKVSLVADDSLGLNLRRRPCLFVGTEAVLIIGALVVALMVMAGMCMSFADLPFLPQHPAPLDVTTYNLNVGDNGEQVGETTTAIVAENPVESFCFVNMTADDEDFVGMINAQSQKDRCGPARTQTCSCANPVQPSMRMDSRANASWQVAFENNLQLAASRQQQQQQLDVVMLGDSITESWHGTSKGSPEEDFQDNVHVYKELFDSPDSPVQGLALGIAGDRCPQLLYRLQHGEIEGLYPKVFWILIGTNDYLGERCDADQMVAGNIRIAQEILSQRPNATVVIQSLLPVGTEEGIDYWDVYSEVNQRLACYAQQQQQEQQQQQQQVIFVNVTQLFVTSNNTVNSTMLPDEVHPHEVGATIWGRVIVNKVRAIIDSNSGRS